MPGTEIFIRQFMDLEDNMAVQETYACAFTNIYCKEIKSKWINDINVNSEIQTILGRTLMRYRCSKRISEWVFIYLGIKARN